MIASIQHPLKTFKVDLSKPIDISIPLENGSTLAAWYVDPLRIEPVRTDAWTGSVKEGGSVNFRNIFFNPHGHGTHTESVGHISPDVYSVNDALKSYFFLAKLISVTPIPVNDDKVITLQQLEQGLNKTPCEALIIRTLPNETAKMRRNYSDTNPPFLSHEAAEFIRASGIRHLLIDLPSVDRESDEGKLLAHRNFWNYPEKPEMQATITEFIFVPDSVTDGLYLLNLQTAPFVNDASPSRPVLFALQ